MNMKYISQRKDGTYQISINIDGKRKTKYAKTINEAIKIRDGLVVFRHVSIKTDNAARHTGKLVPEAYKNWLENEVKYHRAVNTYRCYLGIYNAYVLFYLAALKVDEITRQDVQNMIDHLAYHGGWKHTGLRNTTLSKIIICLSAFFNYLIRNKIIEDNPCRRILLPKRYEDKRGAYNSEERDILLKYVHGDNYEMYLLLTAYFQTGARREELLAVKWKDVDIQERSIILNKALVYGYDNKQMVQEYLKNDQSIRTVYISKDLMVMLCEYQALHDNRENWREGYLFHPCNKSWWLLNTVSRYVYANLKKLGLSKNKRLCLHSARHTMASTLINQGISIPTVQKLGGWRSYQTILKNYASSDLKHVFEAQKKLF